MVAGGIGAHTQWAATKDAVSSLEGIHSLSAGATSIFLDPMAQRLFDEALANAEASRGLNIPDSAVPSGQHRRLNGRLGDAGDGGANSRLAASRRPLTLL